MGDGGGVEEEKEGGSVFTLHGVSSNYSALIAPMSTYVTCVSVTHCNLLYRRLCGSASPVLTAARFDNGRGQFYAQK